MNATAKGQEFLAEPTVIEQQLDLARMNLEGHVARSLHLPLLIGSLL